MEATINPAFKVKKNAIVKANKTFYAKISVVEERFTKEFLAKSVSDAKVEAQMESELVSLGWFIVLEGWPVAMRMGDKKPEGMEVGDDMVIDMTVFKKEEEK